MLPNGKVLVAGGVDSSDNPLTSAELSDPASATWTATGSLNTARYSHKAILLPNGNVLVAGGYNPSSGDLTSAELYDPATGSWTTTGSLNTARESHTATLLPNGKLLVAGGYDYQQRHSYQCGTVPDIGLEFVSPDWQPQIASAWFNTSGKLVVTGTGFSGISSASGGNTGQDSPSNYPVVQLRRLDNEQSFFLLSDIAAGFSDTGFTSVPVTPFSGYALATVFTNGIPSAAYVVRDVTPQISSITRLANGHIVLQCIGVPNQINDLQVSPDLSPNSFATVSPLPAAADGTGAFSYDDAGAVGLTRRFYRLAFP